MSPEALRALLDLGRALLALALVCALHSGVI